MGEADSNAVLVPLNNEWKVTNKTVGTSVSLLLTAPLAQRRLLIVKNTDDPLTGNTIFLGDSDDPDQDLDDGCGAPDLTEGYAIEPGDSHTFCIGPEITPNIAADGTDTPVQILEAA